MKVVPLNKPPFLSELRQSKAPYLTFFGGRVDIRTVQKSTRTSTYLAFDCSWIRNDWLPVCLVLAAGRGFISSACWFPGVSSQDLNKYRKLIVGMLSTRSFTQNLTMIRVDVPKLLVTFLVCDPSKPFFALVSVGNINCPWIGEYERYSPEALLAGRKISSIISLNQIRFWLQNKKYFFWQVVVTNRLESSMQKNW